MAKKLQNLKKVAILAIAMLAISLGATAQIWYIYGEYTWSAPHPTGTFTEHHYQAEDVDINGMEYHTIYIQEQGVLLGAYRNEDNQVYCCKWNGSSYDDEVLLYDYDLEEGEYFNENDEHPMKVTKVTMITDNNGVSRKKISFEFLGLPDAVEFWVEGVGSSRGFFNVGMYEPSPDSSGEMYHLLCYHINDNVIYVNPEYNECDIDDIDENMAENGVSIYPNPAKDIVKILNDNNLNITNIEIIDLTGRIVMNTLKSTDIDISELPEGQYFVKIYGETTMVRKLFIIK